VTPKMEARYVGPCPMHGYSLLSDPYCLVCIEILDSPDGSYSTTLFAEGVYDNSMPVPVEPEFNNLHLGPCNYGGMQQHINPGAFDFLDLPSQDPTTAWDAHPVSSTLNQTQQAESLWGDLQWDSAQQADINPALTSMPQQNSEWLLQGQSFHNQITAEEHKDSQNLAPIQAAEPNSGVQHDNANIAVSTPTVVAEVTPIQKCSKRIKQNKKPTVITLPSKLEQPLSTMAKNRDGMTWQSEITNIEAHVNRSTETRLSELNKGSKIPRPENAFILYRKAYHKRAQEWCDLISGQAASMVTAQSWAIETEELKLRFKHWADIDRINHRAAFPGYQFRPMCNNGVVKSGLKKGKRKLNKLAPPVTEKGRVDQDVNVEPSQYSELALDLDPVYPDDQCFLSQPWQPGFMPTSSEQDVMGETSTRGFPRLQTAAQATKPSTKKRKANEVEDPHLENGDNVASKPTSQRKRTRMA